MELAPGGAVELTRRKFPSSVTPAGNDAATRVTPVLLSKTSNALPCTTLAAAGETIAKASPPTFRIQFANADCSPECDQTLRV